MRHYIHSFSSPSLKGWLLKKARTGFRKTWFRCYFILESQQLRCYKTDQDNALPISKFDLREYQLQNQPSSKPFTFQLIHRSSKLSQGTAPLSPTIPSPDLYLQAENEEERSFWVDALGEQLSANVGDDDQQVDVLNKWLERYDLIVPSTDRFTPSLLSLAPSSSYANDDDESSDDSKSEATTIHHPYPAIMESHQNQQQQQQFLNMSSSPSPSTMTKKSSSSSSSSSSSRFLGFLWTTNSKTKNTTSPLGSGTQ